MVMLLEHFSGIETCLDTALLPHYNSTISRVVSEKDIYWDKLRIRRKVW